MLSKKLLGTIYTTIKRFTFLQILPVSWDSTHNQLHIQFKFTENLRFYFQATVEIIILVPVILLVSRICIENSNNIGEIVMPVIELICTFNAVFFQSGVYFYRYQIVDFINAFLKFEAVLCWFVGHRGIRFMCDPRRLSGG